MNPIIIPSKHIKKIQNDKIAKNKIQGVELILSSPYERDVEDYIFTTNALGLDVKANAYNTSLTAASIILYKIPTVSFAKVNTEEETLPYRTWTNKTSTNTTGPFVWFVEVPFTYETQGMFYETVKRLKNIKLVVKHNTVFYNYSPSKSLCTKENSSMELVYSFNIGQQDPPTRLSLTWISALPDNIGSLPVEPSLGYGYEFSYIYIKSSTSTKVSGSLIIPVGKEKWSLDTFSTGRYTTSMTVSMYDHTERFFEDEEISVGEGQNLYRVEKNELLQTGTPVAENYASEIIDIWGNGRETATIRCLIANYNETLTFEPTSLNGLNYSNGVYSVDHNIPKLTLQFSFLDGTLDETTKIDTPKNGQMSISFRKDSGFSQICLRLLVNGTYDIYSGAFYDVSSLMDGELYTISFNVITNASTQFAFRDFKILHKIISVSGENRRSMMFEVDDRVIPMVYDNYLGDVPMSQYSNGDAKVFQVVGVKPFYDGMYGQEIYLLEER